MAAIRKDMVLSMRAYRGECRMKGLAGNEFLEAPTLIRLACCASPTMHLKHHMRLGVALRTGSQSHDG